MIEKIDLGIDGIDKLFKPFALGYWIALVGGPGSFKTVSCITSAEEQMKKGMKAIYVSTETEDTKILDQADSLGFDWYQRIDDGDLRLFDTDNFKLQGNNLVEISPDQNYFKVNGKDLSAYQALSKAVNIIRRDIGFKHDVMLVVDSVACLWEDKPAMSKKFYRHFRRYCLDSQFSLVLLTSQLAITTGRAFGFGVEHGVDGLIRCGKYFENNRSKHWILCDKMRSRKISPLVYNIDFEGNTLKIEKPISIKGSHLTVLDALSE